MVTVSKPARTFVGGRAELSKIPDQRLGIPIRRLLFKRLARITGMNTNPFDAMQYRYLSEIE
jgi:hypothetical protein